MSTVTGPARRPPRIPGAPAARRSRPADRPAEAPATLVEEAPRTLGLLDQMGFWGNLGVSLLGFSGAIALSAPAGVAPLSLGTAALAAVVGSVLGGLILGSTLVLGARTGAPAMVLLRGIVGARASWLPTALNIAQCVGWAVFELVTITAGLQALTHDHLPRWVCLVLAGSVTTALTIRPLGWIRSLRKYVSVLVVLALVVLAIGLLRHPVPHESGSWTGFWLAVDATIALTISWVPLGADYARHSRTPGSAFWGGLLGYGLTQVGCLVVGLIALAQVEQDGNRIFDLFIGLPLGTIAFAVLVIRETDQSFANVYSTALSIQNLRPTLDRRVLTVALGALVTAAALVVTIGADYANFLYLIGGVFVPLSGLMVAAWLRTGGSRLDLGQRARTRPGMLVAWALGFVLYQCINPGALAPWSDFWSAAGRDTHLIGHPWLSASVASFGLALLVAWPFAGPDEFPSSTSGETDQAGASAQIMPSSRPS